MVALASRHSMTDRWSDDTSEGARAQPKDNASCVAQREVSDRGGSRVIAKSM